MSLILERIKKVNEVNRQNIDQRLHEYYEKVKAELRGTPMKATRRNDFYVWRNGELVKIASRG